MKKILSIVLCLACFGVASAAEAQNGKLVRGTPEYNSVYRTSKAGYVMCKGDGDAIVIADYRAKSTDLTAVKDKLGKFISSYIEIRNLSKDKCAIKSAFAERNKKGVAAVIAISDVCTNAPSMAVFPEDQVVVINATKLAVGADNALFEERLTKQIWRGVAFALGGYASEHPCALKVVSSLTDLDKECLNMTCPPVNFKVMATARKLNVAPIAPLPYGLAVKRGQAPAPTNDIQRAVWDKVKADMAAEKK